MSINLMDFCGKDDLREYLNMPFNFNNLTIATNGLMLVSVPECGNFDPVSKNIINAIKVLLEYKCGDFTPLPMSCLKLNCARNATAAEDWKKSSA